MKHLRSQSGFSLLELLTSIVVIGILAVVVADFYTNRLIDYARTDTSIILQTNTKQALETMEKDLKSARTIEASNQWSDINGPGGDQYGWASSTGSPSTLVVSVPAIDTSGNLIYVDAQHTALQTNDVVYYVNSSNGILYRRIIANPVAGNTAVSTCPPASATSSCPPDGKVIEDVANLVAAYYDGNGDPTTIVDNVYSMDVTLTQTRSRFGRTFSNTLTSRVTLRNKP
ncbi:MAG TPA: type II secretion system protein [Candidatus Saccharimonadales bacterium]|nr:type II secretion system protein [Candidatus Saccharimonadales bacterium]